MSANIVLFDNTSANLDSPTFMLDGGQLTIVAIGMQPGDYITFEVVKVDAGKRSTVCGCRVSEMTGAIISGVQELQCPTCDTEDDPQPVRLNQLNPVVMLDAPQNSLLRAIYHGTGIDVGTVTVWAQQSNTPNLTDAMRGCPPLCCVDTTWSPTGFRRCGAETVDIEEISNCGTHRWTVYCDISWIDTGLKRCVEVNGVLQVEYEQTNQCNTRRWDNRGAATWQATGNFTCVGEFLHIEERSVECGNLRWNDQGNTVRVTWTDTGNTRCSSNVLEGEQRDNCGNLRWVVKGNLAWTPTGNYDCRSNINWREERNQCGDLRWVNTGVACGTSEATMTSLVPASANVVEGQTACWNFTLSGPVIGAPMLIEFDLSGADQVRNAYVTPRSVTLAPGATSGQLCIVTTDDAVIDGNENLCVTPRLSPRLTNAPGLSCILVLDNDANPYNVVGIVQTTPNPVVEGQTVCWDFTVSRPVEDNPLVIEVVWGGADDARNNYPNKSFTIPVGQTVGTLCIQTIDDVVVDGTEALCIASIVGNTRLGSLPALPCVDVLDNDVLPPGDSTHTIASIVPVTNPITEGQQACWLVTLNSAVANSNLSINFNLSGADQARNGYPNPTLVIPVGQSSGTVCVTTTDDVVVDGMEQLCITAITSGRVTAVPAASCINVNDNDVGASIHTVTCVTPPATATEGALVCWTVQLNSPVTVSPLTITGTLSGSEQAARGYPNPTVVIPVGQSSGTLCVQTLDDAVVEGTLQLCLTISTSLRVTSVNDVPCP